jgi:RimJ/RimL family protein N-acetyltransferase
VGYGRGMVVLRAEIPDDLPLLTGGESPFDDFGPESFRGAPASADLDGTGHLTVVDDEGRTAGSMSWHWTQWGPNAGSRCPMIGVWLRPEARGRGLGTAAQRALVDLLFRHTPTHRIEAHTDIENVAEQRALVAAGFTLEGVIREAQWRDGTYRDGHLYSVLRHEWRAQ